MNTLDHLDPSIHGHVDLTNEQRAAFILSDRFIRHSRLEVILNHVEFLYLRPPVTRAAGLVVSGIPGSGKTMVAQWIRRRYPEQPADGQKAAIKPVLMISMTGARDAKTLYNRLLGELGVPDPGRYSGSDREQLVVKLIRAAGVKLLIIDEIQDVLTSTPRQQRFAFDTLKFLMNELSLPIVALGTSAAPDAMRVDEHLNARFAFRSLPKWTADQYLVELLDAAERLLPLKKPSRLSSLAISSTIIGLSGGVLDQMMRIINSAAIHAIETGAEAITPDLLNRAVIEPPVALLREMSEGADQTAKRAA